MSKFWCAHETWLLERWRVQQWTPWYLWYSLWSTCRGCRVPWRLTWVFLSLWRKKSVCPALSAMMLVVMMWSPRNLKLLKVSTAVPLIPMGYVLRPAVSCSPLSAPWVWLRWVGGCWGCHPCDDGGLMMVLELCTATKSCTNRQWSGLSMWPWGMPMWKVSVEDVFSTLPGVMMFRSWSHREPKLSELHEEDVGPKRCKMLIELHHKWKTLLPLSLLQDWILFTISLKQMGIRSMHSKPGCLAHDHLPSGSTHICPGYKQWAGVLCLMLESLPLPA